MPERIASLAVPAVIVLVGMWMLFGKRDYFGAFCAGARSGLEGAIGLLPTLIALLIGIGMLNASGAVEFVSSLLSPLFSFLGIPEGLLPLLLVRPFSGSASSAAYASLLDAYGADSFAALCASVIMGSSDTLFYVVGVYFSSVGIRRGRYALPIGLVLMLFCQIFSCLVCRLWFKM